MDAQGLVEDYPGLFRRVAGARIAIETAEALDRRLETFPPALLGKINAYNQRWIVRALHRGEHLDEVDAALKQAAT